MAESNKRKGSRTYRVMMRKSDVGNVAPTVILKSVNYTTSQRYLDSMQKAWEERQYVVTRTRANIIGVNGTYVTEVYIEENKDVPEQKEKPLGSN